LLDVAVKCELAAGCVWVNTQPPLTGPARTIPRATLAFVPVPPTIDQVPVGLIVSA
jgi:hypothetical protein